MSGFESSRLLSDYDDPTQSFLVTANSTHHPSEPKNLTSPSSDDHPLVWVYIAPVTLVMGVLGNTLTLLVMRRKRLRDTTTSVYLSLISVADTAALVFRIVPEFLNASPIQFRFADLNDWTCRSEKFAFYTASDVAIWLLVAFTIDRLVAVCFPLQKRRVCQPRYAFVAALTLTLAAVCKNLHVFWTRGILYDDAASTEARCERLKEYLVYELYVRPWIAFVTVSATPFCVIVACNVLIVRTLAFVGRMHGAAWKKTFTQTSLMCMSVSLTFLVCVTPSIFLTVGRAHWSTGSTRNSYNIARTVNNQLACLNHAINFFLYCLTGERFRTELLRMLRLRSGFTSGLESRGQPSLWSIANGRFAAGPNATTRSSSSLLALQSVSLAVEKRRTSLVASQNFRIV